MITKFDKVWTEKKLEEILKLKNDFEKELDILCKVFSTAFDSKLIESFYYLFESYCKNISEVSGISEEAIFWFFYENDAGKNKYEVNDIVIDSIKSFVDFEMDQPKIRCDCCLEEYDKKDIIIDDIITICKHCNEYAFESIKY